MKNIKTIHKIILFAVLVNVLAWMGPLLGGGLAAPGSETPSLGFLIWGTAPLVAALLLRLVFRDWGDFGLRPNLKGNGRWYLFSLLVYPAAVLLILGVGLLLGASTIVDFSAADFVTAMIPLAVTFFIFAIFEEFGWRGYLAPKVYALNDSLWGHALVGVVWASWHFPYMRELWTHTTESLVTLLPRFILGTIVFAIVYGEIRIRTNSVWPAVLMHGAGNTIANTLLAGFAGAGFVKLVAGKEYLGSFGVEGLLMIVLFAVLGLLLYRGRRRDTAVKDVVELSSSNA